VIPIGLPDAAARSASRAAPEQSVLGAGADGGAGSGVRGPSTDDYIAALARV
jgi:hypothetical protein